MSIISNIVPTCSVCGAPIIGAYLLDAYGNKACLHHKSHIHFCKSCGRICDSTAVMQSKDVFICSDCSANIPNDKECLLIINYIRSKYLALPIGAIPSFSMIRVPYVMWPKNSESVGVAKRDESGYSVRVLNCLSKTVFAEVMAHELLHLWLYEHNLNPSDRIAEGFCNLGSFEILKGIHTDKSKAKINNILTNPDSVYGDGFRLVKQVYDLSGWDGVIERIKRNSA